MLGKLFWLRVVQIDVLNVVNGNTGVPLLLLVEVHVIERLVLVDWMDGLDVLVLMVALYGLDIDEAGVVVGPPTFGFLYRLLALFVLVHILADLGLDVFENVFPVF